jgi:hypothetical protein
MRGLLVALGTLVGALCGGGLALAGLLVSAQLDGPLLSSEVALALATPGAHVVSWAIGWPLQQEAAIVCYALGGLLTALVLGAVPGAIAGALLTTRSTITGR